jgi:hypothetical protein
MVDKVREQLNERLENDEEDELITLAVLVGCAVYLVGNYIRRRSNRSGNQQHLKAV